jgi:hypothetical protein
MVKIIQHYNTSASFERAFSICSSPLQIHSNVFISQGILETLVHMTHELKVLVKISNPSINIYNIWSFKILSSEL